jgi:hypothetical protein
MTNFIKVVTLIIAVSNIGFVLGKIGADKDLSDSNSAMLASSEITIVEEDEQRKETSLMNGATLSPETPVSIQPVTIPENPAAAKGKRSSGPPPSPSPGPPAGPDYGGFVTTISNTEGNEGFLTGNIINVVVTFTRQPGDPRGFDGYGGYDGPGSYGDYDGYDGNGGGYGFYGGYDGKNGGYGGYRGGSDGDYDRYIKQGQGGPGPEEPEPEPSQEQQAMNMDVVKKPNEPGKSPTYYYSENGNM